MSERRACRRTAPPPAAVRDVLRGVAMPDIAVWSERVTMVLGQNPGPFTGPGTNTYLIGTGRRPLLLDTGHGYSEYPPFLARALAETRGGDSLQGIVLTHAHPDHLGGVESVRRCFGPLAAAKMPAPGGGDGGLELEAVYEGDEIHTEGATLRAVWTPGHAADHLCWYLEEEKALFSGDVVLGAGTSVIPPDGDLGDYLRSLRRLLTLDVAVIYPGHGPAVDSPRERIASYLAHREMRDEQIVAAVGAGERAVTGIVRRIYTDLPESLHHAAAMTVGAHLRKLEAEGLVRCEGEEWIPAGAG